ncbi:MAG: 50S ribosomal protein L32e [Candidatus Thermoplasmatota archaeon]|nr:50S ribosomal protein L32e [Euryarchaeota archaeon]MBU4031929.1 50S ribosomal protein L32e [Candidatus Thermoplasmatota archaeon]MBU4072471.1 50S ribosomal protein L32e [Candidatus Thermoplasmatota archaeon]MBU4144169.1 50S ribosomal protein L32e [Candidatus Thermoplasmatota archaeon]MBU4592803.1 50S ribosomal protein L32e [Candidatus Thermoplasmatota archaeon]
MPEDKKSKKKAADTAKPEPEKPKASAKKADKKDDKFKPRSKPELSQAEKDAMNLRAYKKSKTPHFKRQEWFRYKKLGDSWRRPRGLHSKMRRHISYRTNVVSIGYRGPKAVRGRHPSGFVEVLIHNLKEMEGLDPKKQAIRIAHSVGYLKRIYIAILADQMDLRILNFSREVHDELLAEAKKRGIELPSKEASSKSSKPKGTSSKKSSSKPKVSSSTGGEQ